ncbi:MAG: VWA domain-containing protein [Myxococcaceae bacterium]
MDAAIVEFAEVLRQNGVRVSVSEVHDAALAVEALGVAERGTFRAALRASLVKRAADVDPFERAFQFFFSGEAARLEGIDRSLARRLAEEGLLHGDELQMVLATLRQLAPSLPPMLRAVVLGDAAQVAKGLRGAALALDLTRMQSALEAPFFARRMLSNAGMDSAARDADAIARALADAGASRDGVEATSRHLAAALREVEEAARKAMADQTQARLRTKSGGLLQRPLATLAPAEVRQAETAVRKLVQRLKTRFIRRQKAARHGKLNVRRTMRLNLGLGGFPAKLVFRKAKRERPDLVVLCDVSESVRNVSRLMLLFAYSLQSLFSRVRSFVFVSELGEVTEHFRNTPVAQAVDLATAGKVVSLAANSNYGRALAQFAASHLSSVSQKTTVLVIGDGRNNYHPSNAWALAEIRRKCRRLVWLCPEEPRGWGFGDSEMIRYGRECHQVVVIQTLDDLDRLADQLVPV